MSRSAPAWWWSARVLALAGPLVLALIVIRPALSADQAVEAGSADIAITRFLEATKSECYVYATTTFDPSWLHGVRGATETVAAGWVVQGAAWFGSAADAVSAFGGEQTLAQDQASIWIMTEVRGERRAVQLRAFSARGGTVWLDADFVAAADCKDTL